MSDGLTIEGVDYSQPRHTVHVEGDEAQRTAYIERTQVVEALHDYLFSKKMHQIRLDRFCLTANPTVRDFYIEIGTVLGEVRCRIYNNGERIATVDIRSFAHVNSAKKRIGQYINIGQGKTYVKGRGWVKA